MVKPCIYQALQVTTNENVVELILARKGEIAHESLVVRNSVPQSFLYCIMRHLVIVWLNGGSFHSSVSRGRRYLPGAF